MDPLGKLFGSNEKVKIMRLFLRNPATVLESKVVAKRSQISPERARRELAILKSINFVKSKGPRGWQLNDNFSFLYPLKGLLINNLMNRRAALARRFCGGGKIRLLVLWGIFLEQADSRADLLIVGDKLKRGAVDKVIQSLEAEIGRELAYAVMETPEFNYRFNACDKFVRDVLDYPHERIIDKLVTSAS